MSDTQKNNNIVNRFPPCKKAYDLDDMHQASGEASLVRKPVHMDSGKEYEKCRYAFFPGCQLGAAEPEIIIKTYDSIRFQLPDTGIFLKCCGLPALAKQEDEAFEKNTAEICCEWEAMGCPTLIIPCAACRTVLNNYLPRITTVSLYDFISKHDISGGCNSVDYILYPSHDESNEYEGKQRENDIIKALAEDMGVTFHTENENDAYPYITDCIDCRDMLKNQGKDAVHILELIYGMGASNEHMAHEHDHHEHDSLDSEKSDVPTPEIPLPSYEQRLSNRLQLKELLTELFWG